MQNQKNKFSKIVSPNNKFQITNSLKYKVNKDEFQKERSLNEIQNNDKMSNFYFYQNR